MKGVMKGNGSVNIFLEFGKSLHIITCKLTWFIVTTDTTIIRKKNGLVYYILEKNVARSCTFYTCITTASSPHHTPLVVQTLWV